MKTKVLFLNPPGSKIYIRDYYCSKVSKAYYLPQPVDLLCQTSYFSSKKFDLKVIDAIAEKKDPASTVNEIQAFKPDWIITQCGAASFDEDEVFFNHLKKSIPKTKILSSGDIFLESPEDQLKKYDWLEGIITNFFNDGPYQMINREFEKITGLVYKKGQEIFSKKDNKTKYVATDSPKHELFDNAKYRMPFATGAPIATILTNYACPFPCTFCIMSTLPFISRTAESIINELKYLKSIGTKYIYFSDQTFYISKEITDAVLDFMIEEKLDIEWMCFSRVDILNEEKLKKMKAAGCNLIMFGVEWAEEKYLIKYKKNYTLPQIRETFRISKELGIKRLGTFLIGVPGQSEESIKNTVNFALEIAPEYASFNIAVPRSNTSFREEALDQGLIEKEDKTMDQSGSFIAMGTGEVSKQRLKALRKWAYFKFYFRPSYLILRIKSLGNLSEFKYHSREGWYLIKSFFN